MRSKNKENNSNQPKKVGNWAKRQKRPYIVLTRALKRSTINTAQNVRFILTKVEKYMVDIWEKLSGDQDDEIRSEESYEPADDLEPENMEVPDWS